MKQVINLQTPSWGEECRETAKLAWPLALANLLQMLTYAIDVMFIARLGSDQLAASALAIAIFGMLVWAMSGLAGSLSPMAAAELGARAPALRPIRRMTRMALWLTVIFGAGVMVLCSFAEPFMRLTGQDPTISGMAGDYMGILLFSAIPMAAAGVLRNFVSTLGKPIFATIITGFGILVNALGNYAFIFGNLGAPAWGLEGAAISTFISSLAILGAYAVAIRLNKTLNRYHIFGNLWRPDWAYFKELLRIGLPIGLTVMSEAGVFAAAAFLMGLIGAQQLAAHTLALQLIAFAFMVPMGVSQAITIRVGYFYGAGNIEGVRRAGNTGIVMGTGFMAVTASAMLFAPELLLSLYIDPSDTANAGLVAFASSFLIVGAAFQVSDGLQVVVAGALRGLKDTRMPMWIAIFSYWLPGFGIAATLGLATDLAEIGIWLGLAAGLTVAAVLLVWRWYKREQLGLLRV